MASVLRLGLFLFISAVPLCVLGATYAIPPGWTASNNYKTKIPGGKSPLQPYYYVVNNGSHDIVSNKGTFALVTASSKFSNGPSLAMTSNNSPPYIIQDVHIGGSIGSLKLAEVQLDECGHIYKIYRGPGMQMHAEAERLLLLPTCEAKSTVTVLSRYYYTAMVYGGGFILDMDSKLQTYGVWSLNRNPYVNATYGDMFSSHCSGHKASLVLERNGSLILMYKKDPELEWQAPPCLIPPLALPFRKLDHQDNATPILPFVTMTEVGDVALYKLDTKQQIWVVDSVLVLDSVCKSVRSCGVDSVCDANGERNELLAIGNTSDGPRNLSYAIEHGLKWSGRGVGYSATKFFMQDYNSSLESCGQTNSFLRASFYNHSTGTCYVLANQPVGSLYRDENMTAFIDFGIYVQPFAVEESSPSSRLAVLIIGIAMVFAYTAYTVFAIALLPIMTRKLNSINQATEVETLLSTMQGLPRRFTYTELEAATRGFSTKLGAGGFGSVYKGFLSRDARHIAVKKLDGMGTESAKQFVTEIAGIGGVSHYNIVKLCGFCIEGASKKLLVYEFMTNGSLDRWLFGKDPGKTLNWEQRFNIALGIARGLFYLHEECSEPILHLDIKPQNILLDDKFEAKVADFGLAKMLANRDVTRVETKVRGTPGYMAPEWLVQYAATKKCDVYSYGMLLLELIGGRKNIDLAKINNGESSWYFPAWVVDRAKENDYFTVVDGKVRESESIDDAGVMVKIALWCIQENPVARPSLGNILEMLQNHMKVEEPPMSFCFDHAHQSMTNTVSSSMLFQNGQT